MPSQTISPPTVLPVFVLEKWVPEGSSVYDICLASEKASGAGTIDGATCISGLWRIYPLTPTARVSLLTKGIVMGNKTILLESINPFVLKSGDSESQGTRLTISNLPFSYSNEAVARNLVSAGFKLRSQILYEKTRGPDKLLTDWKNGRRYCWINLPTHEVKKNLKMGTFTAFLYFREMKNSMSCRKCLQKGHRAVDCPNEEVCLSCKLPGHRRGAPECGFREVSASNRRDSEDDYIRLWGRRRHQTEDDDGVGEENVNGAIKMVSEKADENEQHTSDDEEVDITSVKGSIEKVNERNDDEFQEEGSVVSEVSMETLAVKGKSMTDESLSEKDEGSTRTADKEKVNEVSKQTDESQLKGSVSEIETVQKTNQMLANSKVSNEVTNDKNELEEGEIQEENGCTASQRSKYEDNPKKSSLNNEESYSAVLCNNNTKNYKGKSSKISVSEGTNTPSTHRGMVQSILHFVSNGKRGTDSISPEGTTSGKPKPKRQNVDQV